ncbi:hypothetical protein UCRPA7_214 [Phaeoacremonium minimum UCRPA7]|uniref:Uncharacterized protein n=1 Tax=Phaeoacremonium minimum (strain UCR-PA7) TaxID=1286976 RepID=R8BYD3_PHAM7|nr:hypothetical protein UCRPA7_214 [Phaeoacremonium minimum UCRPA7]EOO04304.1 hypothetical protein UCRPA7_214 [Phaeoacremonium minimum UCRPA7]
MASAEPSFTPEMRDRQARGKDPYHSGDASDGSDDFSERETAKMRLGSGRTEQEPFDKIERRDWAIAVLASPELVMMYAQSRGDSIPATRLWLMRVMCGYEDDILDNSFRKRASGPRLDSSSKKKGGGRTSR